MVCNVSPHDWVSGGLSGNKERGNFPLLECLAVLHPTVLSEPRWMEAPPMNYPRFDATIHTLDNFNMVLGSGEFAAEILGGEGVGGWTEVASARLPNDNL